MAERSPLLQILRTPPAPAAGDAATAAAQWSAVTERLRQYAEARRAAPAVEQCEFCGAALDDPHGHLVDVPRRAILCVCRPCYLLFTHDGAAALRFEHRSSGASPERQRMGGARFRAVPDRYRLVPEFAAARDLWDALQIPIGLAFFFRSSATNKTTAFYPSPAGATESELPLDAWDAVAARVPEVAQLAPDVEALLVRRTEAAVNAVDALIVPIDACYELVGRIRVAWRGFQGGDEVWREIDEFFARALVRARESAP